MVGKQGKGEPRISTPGHGQEAHGNRSSATWVSRPAPHCLPPSHNPRTHCHNHVSARASQTCVLPTAWNDYVPCSETPQAGEGEGGRGCGGAKFSSLDYVAGFTALLLRRKYLLWRYALACERLRFTAIVGKRREQITVADFRLAPPPHWHYCSPGRCACEVEVPE